MGERASLIHMLAYHDHDVWDEYFDESELFSRIKDLPRETRGNLCRVHYDHKLQRPITNEYTLTDAGIQIVSESDAQIVLCVQRDIPTNLLRFLLPTGEILIPSGGRFFGSDVHYSCDCVNGQPPRHDYHHILLFKRKFYFKLKDERRVWVCNCCGLIVLTLPQDDASDHQCQQCLKAGCENHELGFSEARFTQIKGAKIDFSYKLLEEDD